ncbi:hypothetical protein MTQ01_05435 [Streptomyces sp. XM4193]|uniref:hypothetical protein n=1 Tax=Streptomyces sp. XM4193 TaxID=2929782 RepID=UPI001FF7B6E1|nr:hypothetical protein [Streptomyces sp. XM4193]MCK1795458.1 hypothetical protein [Streptomyces sp. XM4193]
MKRLLIAVLVTTTVLTAPTIAYATADLGAARDSETRAALPRFKAMQYMETTGVEWEGSYRFLPPGKSTRGAFNFKGKLRSFDKNNGAKLEVRVEGYGKRTYRAARGKAKTYNELVYDGAAQRTKDAWVKLCRDRGTLVPDNCTGEEYYGR